MLPNQITYNNRQRIKALFRFLKNIIKKEVNNL